MSKPHSRKGGHQGHKQKASQQKILRQRDRKEAGTNFSPFIEPVTNKSDSETEEETPTFTYLKRETADIIKLTQTNRKQIEISSTWEKYRKFESEEDNYEKPPDFESLMRMPLASGGHFQFKSEKGWDQVKTNSKFNNKYFSIDLKLLNKSLLTIPAYERLELDPSLLSGKQRSNMDHDAYCHQQKYSVLNTLDEPKFEDEEQLEVKINTQERYLQKEDEISLPEHIEQDSRCDVVENQVFKIQNLTIKSESKDKPDPQRVTSDASVDLDEWLDDILDD